MADDEISALSSLPIESLVAAPVISVARAQMMISREVADFIRQVGMDKNGNLRILPFHFSTQVTGEDGKPTGETKTCNVQAPFLALTGVPNFAIEELDVDFNIKIETMEKTDYQLPQDGNPASTLTGAPGVIIQGRASHGANQTRKSDTDAQYKINLKAKKQQPSEAVMKILDILTQTAINVNETEKKT